MSTPKEAIKEVLLSLNHADHTLWTDDGSPLVTEIQRLANDKTITRAQINEALPGFARKTDESIAEDVQPAAEGDETGGIDPNPLDEVASTDTIINDPAEDLGLSPEQDQERLRGLAFQRVQDAEVALFAAKDAVSDAHTVVVKAEQRHARALQLYAAKYPPLSASENIQQHIARQQEILRERVTGSRFEPNVALNPVDAKLMDRKRDNGRNKMGKIPQHFLPRSQAVSR